MNGSARKVLSGILLCLFVFTLAMSFSLPVAAVEGATRGSSATDLVEDRRIWEGLPGPVQRDGSLVSAEGMHIPRFLFDSEDAEAANAELDEVEASLAEEYASLLNEEYYMSQQASFSVYQDEEILSVHVTYYGMWRNDLKHLVYNFRLEDGKRLSDGEMAEYLGVGDRLLGLIEESIADRYKRTPYWTDDPVEDVFSAEHIEYFEGFAMQNLWEHFSPEAFSVYLDESGQARVVYTSFSPAGGGSYITDTELKLLLRYEDRELSPVYMRMARELGIDPEDERYDALILFVGAGYDKPSVKDMLIRLWPWQEHYWNFENPTALFNAEYDFELDRYALQGYEFYLLVPKYKHAAVSLKALDITEDAELVAKEYSQLDTRSVSGPVLIGQNVSDLWPNAEVTIEYRGEKTVFRPYLSLKDGSLQAHERVLDAGAVLDLPTADRSDYAPYAYDIYWALLSMLGLEQTEE